MKQLRDPEFVHAGLGRAEVRHGQRLRHTSPFSFHPLALCAAIVMAMPMVVTLGAIASASEFGVSTYRPGLATCSPRE
ncbi:MAG TPA: hypothetical protein VNF29_09790 [Candidatus Binataceae bacterium]|nr:hypothetical protein [Candidatus Binataceae bacterium]